jgi:DNA-binding transcriptional regulator YiaG
MTHRDCREFRKLVGLTLEEVALNAGVSVSQLSVWERSGVGMSRPAQERVRRTLLRSCAARHRRLQRVLRRLQGGYTL